MKSIRTAALLLGLSCLLSTGHQLHAGLLVGTFNSGSSPNPTIGEMQQLVNAYNSNPANIPKLPNVGSLVDKIEGDNSGMFTEGVFDLGDFNFYAQNDGGTKGENIFNSGGSPPVNFNSTPIDYTMVGFDDLDNPVQGFDTSLSAGAFFYYTSKAATSWSLWTRMAGFNPVYTDSGTGDSSLTGSGFTVGAVSDTSLDYDPIKNGISNIRFFSSEPIPEPSSIAIWGLGLLGLAGVRRRTRKSSQG